MADTPIQKLAPDNVAPNRRWLSAMIAKAVPSEDVPDVIDRITDGTFDCWLIGEPLWSIAVTNMTENECVILVLAGERMREWIEDLDRFLLSLRPSLILISKNKRVIERFYGLGYKHNYTVIYKDR